MNMYVGFMTEAIDYIEENISDRLGLKEVSKQFHLSEFHFRTRTDIYHLKYLFPRHKNGRCNGC